MQKYLNAEIIGESDLINGTKYIVTRVESESQSKIVCLSFTEDGNGEIVQIIPDFEK